VARIDGEIGGGDGGRVMTRDTYRFQINLVGVKYCGPMSQEGRF